MPWFPNTIPSQILSVHAALLPVGDKGKVLMFGGDEHNPAQGGRDGSPATPANIDRTALYDVNTMTATRISSPTTDVFCAGHAFLGDGRLMVVGGTESWGGTPPGGPGGGHEHQHGNFGGHRACWIYNYRQQSWTRAADLGFQVGPGRGGGRWYPTVLTMSSGDLIAFGGHPSRESQNWHENDLPERYSMAAGNWSWYGSPIHFEHPSLPGNWYPRMNLIRGGQLFITTTTAGQCRFFDPSTGNLVGPVVGAPPAPYNSGWDYSVILMPLVPGDEYRARLLAVNGVTPHKIELNLDTGAPTPAWTPAGTRQGSAAGKARTFSCPIYLPTGQIFVPGGINGSADTAAVKTPEIYTPDIDWAARTYGPGAGAWATVEEPAQIARNYHSVALLLPDGSVFTAGSSINANSGDPATVGQRNIEIFYPSCFSDAARPLIANAPRTLNFAGDQFTIETGSVVQAGSIRKVALIRCGSVTHAADYDQRYVALAFTHQAGTANLIASYPSDPSVLPPGWYMLWIVDAADRPCQLARFVRVAHQSCFLYADRSTFSIMEVQAKIAALGAPARFTRAISAVFDGFLSPELAGGAPTITLHLDHPSGLSPAGVSLHPHDPLPENPALGDDVAQRTTYPYDLLFANEAAFQGFTEQRSVWVKVTYRGVSAATQLLLTRQPNPYMQDGDPPWLSTDVRVIQVREDQAFGAVAAPGANPIGFIQSVLADYRARANNAAHPFNAISQDQSTSRLELARTVGGRRVYNFAVARVRYLGQTQPANGVKVFFRMFKTQSSSMAYNPTTEYRRAGTGADAIPLLGRNGSELVSIPFFATARVNTATQSMTSQTDPSNRQDLTPAAPNEFIGYFGCWVDINQTDPQFPDTTTSDGPFGTRRPIQQLVRGLHQCLVAEVFFDPNPAAPTPPEAAPPLLPWGSTPGTSDKLSQRNLAIVESDNPGGPETHVVQHSFEIRPSRTTAWMGAEAANVAAYARRHGRPDELAIHWNDLPHGTSISVYMPETTADELLAIAAATRRGAVAFEKEDENTVRFDAGTITYLPVPGGRPQNLVGLLTVRLPQTVKSGQVFTVVVQQIDGLDDRVIGSFQLTIPVTTAGPLLPRASRELSLLRYIADAMPPGDRWRPVFDRWLGGLSDKVGGLGGDPDAIEGSPDGDGKAPRPDCSPRALWGLSAVTAMTLTLLGVLPAPFGAPVVAGGLVALAALWCWAAIRCRPGACTLGPPLLLGTTAAGAVLGVLALLGTGGLVVPVLAVCAILSLMLAMWMVARGCCGGCCGGDCDGRDGERAKPAQLRLAD